MMAKSRQRLKLNGNVHELYVYGEIILSESRASVGCGFQVGFILLKLGSIVWANSTLKDYRKIPLYLTSEGSLFYTKQYS